MKTRAKKTQDTYRALTSLTWWLNSAEEGSEFAQLHLAGRYRNLVQAIADREDISEEYAETLLLSGYIERTAKNLITRPTLLIHHYHNN